jgi:hypothetical protein
MSLPRSSTLQLTRLLQCRRGQHLPGRSRRASAWRPRQVFFNTGWCSIAFLLPSMRLGLHVKRMPVISPGAPSKLDLGMMGLAANIAAVDSPLTARVDRARCQTENLVPAPREESYDLKLGSGRRCRNEQ